MRDKKLFIRITLLAIILLGMCVFLYKNLVTFVDSRNASNLNSNGVSNSRLILKTNDRFFITKQIFLNPFFTQKKRVVIRVFNSVPNPSQYTTYGKTKLAPSGDFAFSYTLVRDKNINVVDLYLNISEFEKMDQVTRDKYVTFAIISSAVESQMLEDKNFDSKQRTLRENLLSDLARKEKMPASLLILEE